MRRLQSQVTTTHGSVAGGRPPHGVARRRPHALIGLTALLICVHTGCRPLQRPMAPDAIPMGRAVAVIHANAEKISGTIRAVGAVDGHFLIDGVRRTYHADGALFFLAPRYVRFDIKAFGQRQFLVGSNTTHYWFYDKSAERYTCQRHGWASESPAGLPVRPDQIADALGLSLPQSRTEAGDRIELVQRIVENHQQLLFLVRDRNGRLLIEKEYWLDRFEPRLVRRVVFRDATGRTTMVSELDDYRRVSDSGPLLPHQLIVDWPEAGAQMRFRVSRWGVFENIGPEAIQFAAPPECDPRTTSSSPCTSCVTVSVR